jgi:MerR family transcriptional regulator, thiopeptide resistance regulator
VNTTAEQQTWRVGELAAATGLTVRALHHYDEIGLLAPSGRTGAGHRRYTDADVRRLHQIRALRGFGLSLAEIAEVLAGTGPDPRELLRRQLDQVAERIAVANRLQAELLRVLGELDNRVEPSSVALVELIEVMTTVENRLTPQQVQEMSERRTRMAEQLTAEELAAMSRRRAELAATLTPAELAEMAARRAACLPSPD